MTEISFGYQPNSKAQLADVYHPIYPETPASGGLNRVAAAPKVEVASYDCSQPKGGPVGSR